MARLTRPSHRRLNRHIHEHANKVSPRRRIRTISFYHTFTTAARTTMSPYNSARGRLGIAGGGAALAAVAGYVDAVLLRITGIGVSHATGGVAKLAGDTAAGSYDAATRIVSVLCAFLLGAVVSGAIIGASELKPGRRYGVAMLVQAALLAAATLVMLNNPVSIWAATFAAGACGLQNAMASSYYGLIVRTTHVTGIVTDLGAMIGQRLAGKHIEPWRFGLLAALLTSFFAGGFVGYLATDFLGNAVLAAPAAACAAAGLAYLLWRLRHARRVHQAHHTRRML